MVNFFKTSIESNYIKYILMNTPIPNCSLINEYDLMVEGNYYYYKKAIYKCTKTGIFNFHKKLTVGSLKCSEPINASDYICVTDEETFFLNNREEATYSFVDYFLEGDYLEGLSSAYISNKGYYDPDTHIKLGQYLRFIKSSYGINLMPLYNCYTNTYVDNVNLSKNMLTEDANPMYKTALIPIRFNKKYTIALNSDFPIYIKPVMYDKSLIKNSNGEFLYDSIRPEITMLKDTSFNKPFELSIWNADEDIQVMERYLYLAIQMHNTVEPPIVILEGDAKNTNYESTYDIKMFSNGIESDLDKAFSSKSSLLNPSIYVGVNKIIPMSNRLIEYLVGHTIDPRTDITESVERVEDTLSHNAVDGGVWSSRMREQLYNRYMKLAKSKPNLSFEDILGYVDSDVELALNRGLLSNE